jgi:small-conductance mechanosensitive channel
MIQSWFWYEVLGTALVLLAAWAAAQIYLVLIDRVFKRWAGRTRTTLDDRVVPIIRRPGYLLILLIGVYAALHRYRFRLLAVLDGVIFVIAVILVVYALIKVFAAVLIWYGEKVSREKEGETVARELLPLTDKIVNILLVVFGLVIVFDHFAIDIKSFVFTLGIGSLGVGLALQDTLANIFGGFTIMADRRFRIGDRIRLQSGEAGDVQAIGLRNTTVLTPDGNLLIIPNALMVKTIVTNYSFPDDRALVAIDVGVAFGSDIEKAKQLMVEAAGVHPAVLASPKPAALFTSFAASALQLRLVCYARSFRDVGDVTDAVNTAIREKFRAAAIVVPLPSQSIHLSSALQEEPPSRKGLSRNEAK